MTVARTIETLAPDYIRMWEGMEVKPKWRGAIDRAARTIIANRAQYEAVQDATGVPWEWIGAIHWRESSGNFDGVLHNGEHIIGTDKKTRLKPADRGPFGSWHEAAIDALRYKGLHLIGPNGWFIERVLYEAERYNGWGYRNVGGGPSPYLWSGTDYYERGKFIADGKYSALEVDQQIGFAPLYKRIGELTRAAVYTKASRKLTVLTKVGTAMKTLAGIVGGLFTMQTIPAVTAWFSIPGLTPAVLITMGFAALGVLVLTSWVIALSMEDAEVGRWTPSGLKESEGAKADGVKQP